MNKMSTGIDVIQMLKKKFEKDLFKFMGVKLDPVPVKQMRQTTLKEFGIGD